MRVSEAMTRDVRIANPGQSIGDAAKIMAEIDAGAIPVGEIGRASCRERVFEAV